MIELPESVVLAQEGTLLFKGLTITSVRANKTPHSFCWMNKESIVLEQELIGKTIQQVISSSHYLRFLMDDGTELATGEDVTFSYKSQLDESDKHQLLLGFNNNKILEFKIKLYGFILYGNANELKETWPYYKIAFDATESLSTQFSYDYFLNVTELNQNKGTVKQALATNQHIPGLGNGILQDILFNAHMLPKRKVATLTDDEKVILYKSVIETIKTMIAQNGRNLVTHFQNDVGNYEVLMHSGRDFCPICQSPLTKEAYLGGKVIYCPKCQK